jgi:predicted Zn-dependent peptidase
MLDSARSYVLGQYPMRFETASHWAAAMADLELYGLDRSYIEGYGPALAAARVPQTNAVIEQVFPRAEDLVLVLIGDAAKIREEVRKYGAVTEMSLSDPDFAPHR